MPPPRIGVVLDGFGQPVKQALQSAAQLSFSDVELPAISGEVDPAGLSRSGRRHLLHFISGLGLQLSALGGDFGGGRFSDVPTLEQRLQKTRRIMEMAAELHVPVVTSHLGTVDRENREEMTEVMRQLAEMSDRTGTLLAFETGSADPNDLSELLRAVDCATLGACYDPASLLIDGFDPLAGIAPLANRICLARVRDAVAGPKGRAGHEAAVGQGQIDFAEYLAALDQAGYRRTLFIRRLEARNPLQEFADAKTRIESLLH